MTILEWMATPADLYGLAIEVGHEWDEGMREARASLDKAAETKQANTPKGKRR